MKSILLFFAAFGSASSLYGDQFYVKYVNTFLNNSVQPCENFYSHVCSRNMKKEDGLYDNAEQTAQKWIEEGARKLEQTRNYTRFEKILMVFGAGDAKRTTYGNLQAGVNSDLVGKGQGVAHLYFIMLRRMQYVLGMPDIHMFAPRRFMHEIIQMAERETEVSNIPFTDLTKERFRNMLATLNIEKFDEYTSSTYQEIFDNLDKFFKATGALDAFNESNVNDVLDEFLATLGKYGSGLLNLKPLAPTLKLLPSRIFGMNARYDNYTNSVYFFDTALIMAIDAFAPAKYGSAGVLMAHEMYHSILRSEEWTNDVKLGQHAVCLASHMENVCNLFKEGDCVSGAVTYNEDAADMEATQLLFKMLRNKIGDQLKNYVDGTKVTNKQMFFYANAIHLCELGPNHQKFNGHPSGWDTHSSAITRINGVPSLMKAFHEAFKCKAGDKMFDVAIGREKCNAFGEPVRK